MNQNEILKKINDIFNSFSMESYELKIETRAIDIEEWDSIFHVTFLAMLEENFKIRFLIGETDSFENIGQLVELIYQKTMNVSIK
jgi:acyl carrier protein